MRSHPIAFAIAAMALVMSALSAQAQDKGTLNPTPLPPLANPNDPSTPAKDLFGRKPTPANMQARAIGFYTRGCLAGGIALPVNGPSWQVMRLSRNRNWGHPDLVKLLERLADKGTQVGWNGLLVGDMAQARGGPMLTGHASHQVGLDADLWLTQMPNRELTRREREEMSATNVVRADKLDIEPKFWTPQHTAIIRLAAQDSAVERVIVNPAIKKALCREAKGDRSWLRKVRPWYGHNYHFHVRIGCPKGSVGCKAQDPTPEGDGCGSELAYWFQPKILNPPPPKVPAEPRKYVTMKDLPAECRQVLLAQ